MLQPSSAVGPRLPAPIARCLLGAACACALALSLAQPALAGTAEQVFKEQGQTEFVVPASVTSIHVQAIGGEGLTPDDSSAQGGAGAEVSGDVAVTAGEALYLEVDVGGGKGGGDPLEPNDGGGDSDVRMCSAECEFGGAPFPNSPATEILVAAGGGGAGMGFSVGSAGSGGAGGLAGTGLSGGAGESAKSEGGGGGPTSLPECSGGAGGPGSPGGNPGEAGRFAQGGAGGGGPDASSNGGGGGGSGFFGGCGGGSAESPIEGAGGGGGGSSWVNNGSVDPASEPALPEVTSPTSSVPTAQAAEIKLTYTDTQAPAVTIASPAPSATTNATPTFAGTAGTEEGDEENVTVNVYEGSEISGTPVEKLTTKRQPGGEWSVPAATPLPSRTYTAAATQTDAAGNEGSTVGGDEFNVDADPPTIAVTAPAANAAFPLGAVVASAYSCADPVVRTVASGLATCAGPVADGAALDTATVGSHAFTVNATDNVGNAAMTTVDYTVLAPPSASSASGGGGSSSAGAGGAGEPVAVLANAGLRFARESLRVSRRGCTAPVVTVGRTHPPPCAALVTLLGTIDPRAGRGPLTFTASGPHHRTVRARIVLTGAKWTAHLALPLASPGKLGRWKVKIAFAGNSALYPATLVRTLADLASTSARRG